MYADDLLIITDSFRKLRKASKLCEDFGNQKEIKFNPKKTQIMSINSKNDQVTQLHCLQLNYKAKRLNGTDLFQDSSLASWRAYHALKAQIEIECNDLDQKNNSRFD
ncbi:hypothetical protein BpHYR1_052530 [Brachionus plicatilis]|uniref:Reverse transcriptase domain-containing protein n=1 Tax=Brachionus plicatilis TaxID=10195 RepID=A0A3M7PJP2_BRAPC|nr:hypothetical protein BpHYR1_052530 [Brachionus plicatilis]